MTGLTSAQLPPRDIRPPSTAKTTLRFYLLLCVLPLLLIVVIDHNSTHDVGYLAAAVFLVVLVGVEVPLVLRSQRRRHTAIMRRNLGPGEFFTSTVWRYPLGGRPGSPQPGKLALSEAGARFDPRQPGDQGFAVSWGEVDRISLGPMPSKAGILTLGLPSGRLVLQSATGETAVFRIINFAMLATVLAEHP